MAIYYSMVTSTFSRAGQVVEQMRCYGTRFLLDGTGHDVFVKLPLYQGLLAFFDG